MEITGKGQVTIPQEIRSWPGLLPQALTDFELAGSPARTLDEVDHAMHTIWWPQGYAASAN